MSVRNQYIKVGDKLRYLGGDVSDISGRLIEDEEYVVKKIDKDGDYIINAPLANDWVVAKDGYNSACFEPVRHKLDIYSVDVGDKVRYLGGDPVRTDSLTVGKVYEISRVDEAASGSTFAQIKTDHDTSWIIGKNNRNLECFELVENDKDKESVDYGNIVDIIVNLSREVANLRKRLEHIEDSGRKHGDHIEMLMDDIVMLDERTQDVGELGHKLVKKEVYIYDAEEFYVEGD